jgi:hypothetical protein
MLNHTEICKHCDGPMSARKPVNTGCRKGQIQAVCTICRKANYLAARPLPMAGEQMVHSPERTVP